jgi:hypothetical protein
MDPFATCPVCKREMVPTQSHVSFRLNGFPFLVVLFQPHYTRPDTFGGETCKGSNQEVNPQ